MEYAMFLFLHKLCYIIYHGLWLNSLFRSAVQIKRGNNIHFATLSRWRILPAPSPWPHPSQNFARLPQYHAHVSHHTYNTDISRED